MQRSESLKKNQDFQKVYRNGTSYANRLLVMYVLKNQHMKNRLGISVSKKVGNSVVRHRLTRLIRESYRLNEAEFENSLDIVVVARPQAKDRTYQEIESALMHLAGKHCIAGFSPRNIMIHMIRLYQKYISPMKRTKCPYIPTCSQYGLEAIEKYGALKGGLLAVWRILRCNPFSHGGYDPVP
mgnify:CR=1 FL=1